MVRSQSTDSINDLAESLLMDMSGNQSKMEDETHQIHSSRGEYFAPIPQLSHQSGNSMYSLANGNTQNSANLSNGDTKSMIIMPNLQPNRYQAPPQQQHLPHPTPLPHSHQGDQQAQLPQQQQSHYQQFIPHNQQQNSNQPFYYQKQPSYHQPSQNVTPTVGAQSLPYMSRSISVDSYSPASPPSVVQQLNTTNANKEVTPFSKKIPRNCELEEYARRYEALQRQSSARRRSSREQKKKQLEQQQKMESNGPKSLQHHMPLNGAKSCPNPNSNNHKNSVNQTNSNKTEQDPSHYRSTTLMRKYSNDLWNVGGGGQMSASSTSHAGDGLPHYRESGRESVSTILSNSSSETVRYQDSLINQNGGHPIVETTQYHSLHPYVEDQKENTMSANGTTGSNGYNSIRSSKQPMSISEFAFNDTTNPTMPPSSISWQQEKEKTLRKCDNDDETITTATNDNVDNIDGGHSDALYASLNFGVGDKHSFGGNHEQYASMSYLQANNIAKDLKRFPLQTYANGQPINESAYDESGYSMIQFSNTNLSNVGGHKTLKQRKNGSKGYHGNNNEDALTHSKSVPNLSTEKQALEGGQDVDENGSPVENSFSYLDPEKRLRVSDNTLKLIQKQALRDYFDRHHTLNRKSSQSSSSANKNNASSNNNELDHKASVSSLQNPAETSNSSSTDLDSGFYSPTENSKHQTLDTSNNNEVKSSNESSPSTDIKSLKMGSSFDIKRNYSHQHRSASQSSTRSSLSSTSTATTIHRKSSVDTVINASTASIMNSETAIYCNGSVTSSFKGRKSSFNKVSDRVLYFASNITSSVVIENTNYF